MDASIMDGLTMNASAVAGVKHIRNPIAAARKVMENSLYVLLMGEGAQEFAKKENLRLDKPHYFYSEDRHRQLMHARDGDEVILDHSGDNKSTEGTIENGGKKLGTVGAVALDKHGNVAAATSTDSMTAFLVSLISDCAIMEAVQKQYKASKIVVVYFISLKF